MSAYNNIIIGSLKNPEGNGFPHPLILRDGWVEEEYRF